MSPEQEDRLRQIRDGFAKVKELRGVMVVNLDGLGTRPVTADVFAIIVRQVFSDLAQLEKMVVDLAGLLP